MKSKTSLRGGFTLIELLVVIAIIALLASLSIPAVGGAIVKAQLAQAVSNARQLNIATTGASADGSAQNDSTIGWPADTGAADSGAFLQSLGQGGYLKFGDLKVAGAGKLVFDGGTTFTPADHFGFIVYKVGDTLDASDAIFLTTKNVSVAGTAGESAIATYGTAGNKGYDKTFANKGFVVFAKGGSGTYILKESSTKSVGSMPANAVPALTEGSTGLTKSTFETAP